MSELINELFNEILKRSYQIGRNHVWKDFFQGMTYRWKLVGKVTVKVTLQNDDMILVEEDSSRWALSRLQRPLSDHFTLADIFEKLGIGAMYKRLCDHMGP